MKKSAVLAGLALLAVTAVSAEARDRWRYRDFNPWHDDRVIWLEEDEDEVVYYDDEDDVIIRPRERLKQRAWRDAEDDADIWWLEDGARRKLEARPKKPNIVPAKPAKKAAKPLPTSKAKQAQVKKPAKPVGKVDPVVTASIAKPVAAQKTSLKPVAKPVVAKADDSKSIGCTAGAAVIVGYGFADVKPKACTGKAYAYTANRAGKAYEIKLTAASGEITDVKKLN